MYSVEKHILLYTRDRHRLYVKGNGKRRALRKLAQYLRNERGYSEKEIKKFMAESFVGEVDY